MRKLITILLVIVATSIAFDSCTSYENGPAFSLQTPKKRIAGEWHLTDVLVNDKHEQTLFDNEANSILTLNSNGSFIYNRETTSTLGEMTGQWTFGEDKTELVLTQTDTVNTGAERIYKITRLSKNEMWLVNGSEEYSGIDDLIERHFEKKEE